MNTRRHQQGFGITEFIITMSMLACAVGAWSFSSVAASNLFRHQRLLTEAVAIADLTSEELLLKDGSDEDLAVGDHTRYFDAQGRDTTETYSFYVTRWTVSTYDAVVGIRQIDIEVTWDEGGSTRSLGWSTWRN